jgi:hypothetical protein
VFALYAHKQRGASPHKFIDIVGQERRGAVGLLWNGTSEATDGTFIFEGCDEVVDNHRIA